MDYLALRRLPMSKRQSLVRDASANLYYNDDFETLLAHMLIETETDTTLEGVALSTDVNRKAMMRDGVTAIFDEMQSLLDGQAIGESDDD